MKLKYLHLLFSLSLLLLISCGNNSSKDTKPPKVTDNTAPFPASIDVLVLYDKGVQDNYANVHARINHLFAVSNNIYKDSQLNVTIHAKEILFYDTENYPALEELASSNTVQALRAQYQADTVLLYQMNPEGDVGLCGLAYSASSYAKQYHFKDAMYANVAINCPSDTTAHEIGHNMGLLHSHKQDGNNATPYSYGLGHGIDGQFATIMAYAYIFETDNQIAKFSSPEYECLPGYPCGIPIGQQGESHATKIIEITAPKIANIYP